MNEHPDVHSTYEYHATVGTAETQYKYHGTKYQQVPRYRRWGAMAGNFHTRKHTVKIPYRR